MATKKEEKSPNYKSTSQFFTGLRLDKNKILDTKKTPSLLDNQSKHIDSILEMAQKKALAAQKLREVKPYLSKEEYEQLEEQLGLNNTSEKEDNENEDKLDMIALTKVLSEADPEARKSMMPLILQSMNKNKGGNEMVALMMMSGMMNGGNNKQDSWIEEYFKKKIISEMDSPKKDDISTFKEMLSAMNEIKSMTGGDSKPDDPYEKILQMKKVLGPEGLGLLSEPTGGPEQMKWELELKKLDMEHEIRKAELDGKKSESEGIQTAIKTGATALATMLPALLGKDGNTPNTEQAPQKQEGQAQRGIKCINEKCGIQIPVHLDRKYPFDCPECKQKYLSTGTGTVEAIQDNTEEKTGEEDGDKQGQD